MKSIIIAVFTVFISISSAYAIDVSVIDGRAQVGSTLNTIQSRVETLNNAVNIQANVTTRNAVSITAHTTDIGNNATNIGVVDGKTIANAATIGGVETKVDGVRACGNTGKVQRADGACITPAAPDPLASCTNGQLLYKNPSTALFSV